MVAAKRGDVGQVILYLYDFHYISVNIAIHAFRIRVEKISLEES